jgi:hypothetical protein
MAYIINRFNGTVLTTVEDGTINQTTDLKFIGKNYSGYGEAQNENLVFLLENFAGATPPPRALSGQIWFDAVASKIKFYDGVKWRTAGTAEVSNNEPVGLVEGDLWYKPTTRQLYARTGDNNFVLIGPQVAGTDTTQLVSDTVVDSTSVVRPIIKATVNGVVVFVTSNTEFTLSQTDPIPGFDVIKRGITLVNTLANTNGVTTNAGQSGQPIIWGTASNALLLNGKTAADFATIENNTFTTVVNFPDDGIDIDDRYKIYVGSEGNGRHDLYGAKLIRFAVTNIDNNETTPTLIVKVAPDGFHPETTDLFNLGKPSLRWSKVYAEEFIGTVSQSDKLKLGTSYINASTVATPNTIAARTTADETINGQTITAGALKATFFVGRATQAQYADLAEKYTTDQKYPTGTVMTVCDHGEHETEACSETSIAVGVISEKPAYLMNSEIDGQPLALKGRVPVRVVGPVKKGQAVYTFENGTASTKITGSLVGVALESNFDAAEKLVECVLKL